MRSATSRSSSARVSVKSAISRPRVSQIEMGTPSLVISRVSLVTGRPWPVSASLPWKTALISVDLPTPVRPAIRMFIRPRSRTASSMARWMPSARSSGVSKGLASGGRVLGGGQGMALTLAALVCSGRVRRRRRVSHTGTARTRRIRCGRTAGARCVSSGRSRCPTRHYRPDPARGCHLLRRHRCSLQRRHQVGPPRCCRCR